VIEERPPVARNAERIMLIFLVCCPNIILQVLAVPVPMLLLGMPVYYTASEDPKLLRIVKE
jgi:hypothetical protein